MTSAYLIEYAIDGEASVDLMDGDRAAGFLARGIEHAYYSGTGFDVTRMFRYDDGDDYLHYPYEVWPVGGPSAAAPEFTFTVTIDGRA
jgi:hypothetical protein